MLDAKKILSPPNRRDDYVIAREYLPLRFARPPKIEGQFLFTPKLLPCLSGGCQPLD